eukprot:12926823-Prorocentrum_lima.AAC.1
MNSFRALGAPRVDPSYTMPQCPSSSPSRRGRHCCIVPDWRNPPPFAHPLPMKPSWTPWTP